MDLPLEIIERIVLYLPVSNLLNCKLVCKGWKEALSCEQFCRNCTLHHNNFVDGAPSGFLEEWLTPENWYCYWVEDCYQPSPEKWVFKNPPKQWKSGIVHPEGLQPESPDPKIKFTDFLVAMTTVNKLQKGAVKFEIYCLAWGNESDGLLHPFIMPWNEDRLPRHEDIFNIFKFHPKMFDGCQTEDILGESGLDEEDKKEGGHDDYNDNYDENEPSWRGLVFYKTDEGAQEFHQFLKKLFSPGVMMCIGCDAMNSVPVFYLAKLAPGWVGGYMSGVVCT